jgi:hypothetical protein
MIVSMRIYLGLVGGSLEYAACLFFCPIAELKELIYTCKLCVFAMLLNKIEQSEVVTSSILYIRAIGSRITTQ